MKLKIAIILSLFLPWLVVAQCPYGEGNRVDCQYGCGNYVDNNHDNYCDHSSLSATKKEKATDTICQPAEKGVERGRFTPTSDTTPSAISENTIGISEDEDIESVEETDIVDYSENISETAPAKRYHFWLITLITLGLYIFTFILMQTGLLPKVYHRRIWNALLLVVGLLSCILGFLMVIHLNYPFLGAKYLTFLTWHVEAGIAMTIIMLFHIAWHWKYFKNIFTKVKRNS